MPPKSSRTCLPSNWEELNYYELLNVTPEASPDEIRDAYLKIKELIRKELKSLPTSPSSVLSPLEQEKLITRIEEAYQILSDDQKRKIYQARLYPTEQSLSPRISFRHSIDPLIIEPVQSPHNLVRKIKSYFQKLKKR
jgi:curved DNA-binding protein CbpA